MLTLLTLLDFCLGFVLVLIVKQLLSRRSASGPLPPGPRPLPLIGNLLDMPASHEWLTFAKWGDIYGDMISLTVLGQRTVILNSLHVALDLLDKRSAKYSNRPNLIVAGELLGWDQTIVLSQYGEHLRSMRRLFHQFIGKMEKFHDLEEEETHNFLRLTLRDPDNVAEHIRKTAGAIILKMGYGYNIQEERDPLVDIVDKAVEGFSSTTAPGAFLVDSIPALRYVPSWLPGAGWKLKAKVWRADTETMRNVPYNMAKAGSNDPGSDGQPNFVTHNLEYSTTPEREFIVKGAAAAMYSGGADTTVSAVYSFFLAMTLYPDVQKKAQEEIDSVIGHDRLPTVADQDKLPYINALVLEILRWNPVGPLGVPHCLAEDDVYNGYAFSKGTVFVANIWKILHDPHTYRDPMTFNPERFLAPSSTGHTEPDPRVASFGFGRRICPGLHLAQTSIFTSCVMSLAVFNITKAFEDGKEITPPVEYVSGTISHPKPFRCSIKPRSAQAEELIFAEHQQ